ILYQQGQYDDSVSAYRRALELLTRSLGGGHEDTLAVLLDLGRALHRLGDPAGALAAFQQNLDGVRATAGSEHPRVAGTLNAIGQVHYSQGDFKAALDHYHQALEIRQRTLGPDHWQTATSRFNCGTAMRELGDPWGQTEMQSAADTLERLLGPQHPHVLATRSWLR
ncbi:MAG TPA: tetratricopeptide repeat protein, partial [Nannocystis sp.]